MENKQTKETKPVNTRALKSGSYSLMMCALALGVLLSGLIPQAKASA